MDIQELKDDLELARQLLDHHHSQMLYGLPAYKRYHQEMKNRAFHQVGYLEEKLAQQQGGNHDD